MTRTQSQLCSHTCISHSITDNVSNVSPLKELYTTNLRLANMRVLPPSLYDPDGSCLGSDIARSNFKSRFELRIAVNAAET